ncbi:Protein of unknown function [Aliiroseovarius halocynthiae]|uniref:DUF2793 domain-containing protein n=2 Tax=Aliiroseovarius halocynthiae TaxID=985055 RepID=A0A545SNP3_9RHOB|nr:DUF2793 domain-containing protein [Aliiroseovarius halocynthiae]TQV66476.1 DUF2793 domain-containing protein [Aliiroseovarius halocynthiae]SMR83587.1 Protein of unknown function [Aliiroseovarius halocynthiae]
MSQSPVLSLPLIQPSQAQKHVTHNEALRLLDVLVQLVVQSADNTAPPASPADGDRHIVASGATGDWAGQDHMIAVMENSSWQFFTPLEGWRADVTATAIEMRFDGSTWVDVTVDTNNLSQVGINTSADATNRLSVASDATLLTHAGTSHQLKINKASNSDTSTLLFQDNWSGRAEMGLAGNDDFSIKTSADGSSWNDTVVATGDGNVGIGKTPDTKLDVDGIMKLTPVLLADLPSSFSVGAGAIAFVSDASGGAQLAYCDGSIWKKVANGTAL